MAKPRQQKSNQKNTKAKTRTRSREKADVHSKKAVVPKKQLTTIKKSKEKLTAPSPTIGKGRNASNISKTIPLEVQSHNDTCFALSPDGRKILTYGYRITPNLQDYHYLVKLISVEENITSTTICAEFDWNTKFLDALHGAHQDITNCIHQKVKKTVVKNEYFRIDVDSKNRKTWFVVFKDHLANRVILEYEEFLALLQQKNAIDEDHHKYLLKKVLILRKFDVLQNLLAFYLNGKRLNDSMLLKDIPKGAFNVAVQSLDNLWTKLDKFL